MVQSAPPVFKPQTRDPKRTWNNIWTLAKYVYDKRGCNCINEACRLMAELTRVRDITNCWVPDDSAENALQSKVTNLYALFERFNDKIQNQNLGRITAEDWEEFNTFLTYTHP